MFHSRLTAMIVPAMRNKISLPWCCMHLLMLFAAAGHAQEPVDPPDVAARLSYVEGAVSVAPAGTQAWGEALLNRPLTGGDQLWVGADGRAELEIGIATVRLAENTAFAFTSLRNDALQMRLDEGVVVLRIDALDPALPVSVTTPNVTVTPQQTGVYSIEAPAGGAQTIVKVHSGAADVTADGQRSYGVAANEQGVFTAGPEAAAEFFAIAPPSAFESWAFGRDIPMAPAVTTRYVAAEVVGYRDLDVYGSWRSEPDYGPVWRPAYVGADWAPYRYGRWLWVSPWGWTWVDDAPWGYAPFHYGRWAYVRQSWCWVPGPRYVRPVYAPALVGWVGSPGYYGYAPGGYGPGSVGWFPLAPREAYLPGYRASWRHFHNVNVSNTIINNTYINNAYYGRGKPTEYQNRRTPHGTTVVDRDAFVSARRVGEQRRRPDEKELKGWQTSGRAPTILPRQDSLIGVRSNPPTRAPHNNSWQTAAQPTHSDAPQRNVPQRSVPQRNAPQRNARPTAAPASPRAERPDAPAGTVAKTPAYTRSWAGGNDGARATPQQPAPHQRTFAQLPPRTANGADNASRNRPQPSAQPRAPRPPAVTPTAPPPAPSGIGANRSAPRASYQGDGRRNPAAPSVARRAPQRPAEASVAPPPAGTGISDNRSNPRTSYQGDGWRNHGEPPVVQRAPQQAEGGGREPRGRQQQRAQQAPPPEVSAPAPGDRRGGFGSERSGSGGPHQQRGEFPR
jgi:hypothetical protein